MADWAERIPAAIAKAEGILTEASPGPWFWNGYSGIFSGEDLLAQIADLPDPFAQRGDELQSPIARANAHVATLGSDAVALAKALWEAEQSLALEYGHAAEFEGQATAPLRAFVEKVEAL